jgi:hypothetical protein
LIDHIPATVNALIALTNQIPDDSGKEVFGKVKGWQDGFLDQGEHSIESSFSEILLWDTVNNYNKKLLLDVIYFLTS